MINRKIQVQYWKALYIWKIWKSSVIYWNIRVYISFSPTFAIKIAHNTTLKIQSKTRTFLILFQNTRLSYKIEDANIETLSTWFHLFLYQYIILKKKHRLYLRPRIYFLVFTIFFNVNVYKGTQFQLVVIFIWNLYLDLIDIQDIHLKFINGRPNLPSPFFPSFRML